MPSTVLATFIAYVLAGMNVRYIHNGRGHKSPYVRIYLADVFTYAAAKVQQKFGLCKKIEEKKRPILSDGSFQDTKIYEEVSLYYIKCLEELNLPAIQLDVKTGNIEELGKEVKSVSENVNGAISVFGQLGQAMQDIDDPGAKVAGIIMEAIANVAGAFAKSLMGTFNPWEFIAASIAGVSTMISTIAAIKQVTSGGGASAGKFAQGGVVGGNSYSGDRLMAYVNSGETILTPSQADKAMAGIQGNPMQNLQLSTEISGTNLRIVLNNDNRSKGGSRGYYANIH